MKTVLESSKHVRWQMPYKCPISSGGDIPITIFDNYNFANICFRNEFLVKPVYGI